MILKLGKQHQGLKLYKNYVNGDPGLTLTYQTARSNLVACMFEWEKCSKVIIWENLGANDQITRIFIVLKKTIDPSELSGPCPGAVYMYMTIIFKRILHGMQH